MRHAEMVEYNGRLYTYRELQELSGIGCNTIRLRIRRGWPVEQAVSEPPDPGRRKSECKAWHYKQCFKCTEPDCTRPMDKVLRGERAVNKMFLPKVRPDEYH